MAGMLNNLGLGLILYARDLATPALRSVRNSVYDLGNQVQASGKVLESGLRQLGTGLAVTAAGAVAAAGINKVADAAGEFEYEMAGVGAVAQKSKSQLDKLTNSVANIGLQMTMFAPSDAAKGMRIFTQAGISAENALKALQPTLDMSVASLGQLGLDESAGLAIAGLKIFNLSVEDTTWMLDRMAKATLLSNMQFADLPLLVGVAARGVSQINASLEDTLLSLGMIRNVIPTVERSATALATAMEGLAKAKSSKAIKDMIGPITDLHGRFLPFVDVMGRLAVKLKSMTEEQQSSWIQMNFGSRASAGILIILKQLRQAAAEFGGGTEGMRKAIAKMRLEMKNADGTMADFRDRMLNTWKGQKQALAASFKGLQEIVGLPFAQVLKPFVHILVVGFTEAAKMFKSLSPALQKVFALVLALSVFATILAGLITTISAVVALLGLLDISLATIGLVVAAVVAAIAGLTAQIWLMVEAWKANIGGVQDVVLPIFEKIYLGIKAFSELMQNWEGTMSGFSKSTADALNKIENAGLKDFVISAAMLVYRLWVAFKAFAGWVGTVIKPLLDALVEPFFALWKAVNPLIDAVFELLFAFGIGKGILGETSSGWEKFGHVLGAVVAGIAWVLIGLIKLGSLVTKVFFFPMKIGLKMLEFTIRLLAGVFMWFKRKGIDPLLLVIGPFLATLALFAAPFIALGVAIWAVWKYVVKGVDWMVGKVTAAFDWLKETILKPLADLIALPFEALGVAPPGWVRDFQAWTGGQITPGAPAPTAVPAVVGPSLPAAAVGEMAMAGAGTSGGMTLGPRGEVLNNFVIVNVDGEPVAEAVERKQRKDLARSGGIPCARCH